MPAHVSDRCTTLFSSNALVTVLSRLRTVRRDGILLSSVSGMVRGATEFSQS